MKDLLQLNFGKHYKSTKQVNVVYKILHGKQNFFDSQSCSGNNCPQTYQKGCDKKVLNCNFGDNNVEVIYLENFIDRYQNLKAITNYKKCDLLFSDKNKIVFCEMTCSYPEHLYPSIKTGKLGKIQHAKEQIINSINLLKNVPSIGNEIFSKSKRVALFALREKQVPFKDSFDQNVMETMNSFSSAANNVFSEPMFSDIGDGFKFTLVKYPDTYIW